MNALKQFGIFLLLFACVGLSGCVWSSLLANSWSENFALASYGSEANHPALNDGRLDTVAAVAAKNERIFTLRFPEVKQVRKIIVHNVNLFWFHVDYWDLDKFEWKTVHSVRQLRDIGEGRVQSEIVIDRLNCRTNIIRINVSRTVDDNVITKVMLAPGDKVVDRRTTLAGAYYPHFRVIQPAWAQVREIEVYHLASK
jgi:hypothetical protein